MNGLEAAFDSPVTVAELGISINDPIAHLLDCHRRIARSMVTIENAVASLSSTAPVLRAEAAAALDYELALLQLLSKLHQQDEEHSLFPRLRNHLCTEENHLRRLIEICQSQHREQEAMFGRLAVCLQSFPSSGWQADERLMLLEALVVQFGALCRPHMDLEDVLITASREHLKAEDLGEMLQEMRQRYQA